MKVFFSYASEDSDIVEQVFVRVKNEYPDMAPWLDKYEIIGGDDLIEKINAGIDDADRFLVFLSANSIDKPWVRVELRKALMNEIKGIKPHFIIPVKVGDIPSFPPFLESRRYIDLSTKTETEWLGEIRHAIQGSQPEPDLTPKRNLHITVAQTADEPSAAAVVFRADYWAEDISFEIRTSADIELAKFGFPGFVGMKALSIVKKEERRRFGVCIKNEKVTPRQPFVVFLKFSRGTDPVLAITNIGAWQEGYNLPTDMSFVSFGAQAD